MVLCTDETRSGFSPVFFTMVARSVFIETHNDYKKDCEISVLLTADGNIRELNKKYRNKDYPTDVLSFQMDEDNMLGDIVISMDRAKEDAEKTGNSLECYVTFLFIHGLLHLLGYNHENSKEEEREMFTLQDTILKKLIDVKLIF